MNDTIFEFKKGTSKKFFSWLSKKMTFGEDSIYKVFNKIKLNGFGRNLQLDGTNNESSDCLLIKTSEGTVPTSAATYVSKGSDSEYKLKGASKKGRWVQIFIEDINEPIDSLGFIFRRKTTK